MQKGKFNEVQVKKDERVDDLETHNLFILQKKSGYCFSSDAVLLANFAKVKKTDKVIDLCSGSGIIGILIAGKQNPQEVKLVEIQKSMAEMSNRSIQICGLQDRVESICAPIQKLKNKIPTGYASVVTVNPPYTKKSGGKISEKVEIAIARHEIEVTLEEIIKEASRLLKFGGYLYMVHQVERLQEVFCDLNKYKLFAKEIIFVHPKNKQANVFLIKAKKGGASSLVVNPPIQD